jgi:hypothetical protein
MYNLGNGSNRHRFNNGRCTARPCAHRANVVGIPSGYGQGRAGGFVLGLPKTYRTLDEVLADDEYRLSTCARPTFCTMKWPGRLGTGRHVVCEKPWRDSKETAELRAG